MSGKVFNMVGGAGGGGIKLSSIAITTPPSKTVYKVGETFFTADMVVTATYSNGATAVATGYNFTPSGALAISDTAVTIQYTEGGVTKTATQVISVTKTQVSVPTQSGTLTYSGDAQTPSWSGYDSDKMTLGGDTSGTSPGNYTATFTLKDTTFYEWSDGTTAAKNVTWSIGKAASSLSITPSSLALDATTATGTITVTRAGDGVISASSSDTSKATVSVSGNIVTVTGVANGSAIITISVAEGTNYLPPENQTCAVTVSFVSICGVLWDGTATTALSRTDDAALFTDPVPYVAGASVYSSPFDNLYPWSGIVKEERTGGTMVKIPKFWFKWTKSGNTLKLQIADAAVDGFSVSPAHMDRGDGKGERDYVYVGRYHCNSSYLSSTGSSPVVSITRSSARSYIHAKGTNIWQMDYAMRLTIQMLYLVEFADWNSQAKIGYGCGNNSAAQAMGYTDSMPYHTGTTQSSRTTYGLGTQYRWIEGLWDNVYDWMDGCYYSTSGMSIIKNPANFSDTANGTVIGTPSGGYPTVMSLSTVSGFEWVMYPTTANGSDTTYIPDNWSFSSSIPCLFAGGVFSQYLGLGFFFVGYTTATDANGYHGCRLQELP